MTILRITQVTKNVNGTNPIRNDTDGDDWDDGPEVYYQDHDDDGMATGWEYYFNFDPYDDSDRMVDTDGDGHVNYCEYKWDTNPRDIKVSPVRVNCVIHLRSVNAEYHEVMYCHHFITAYACSSIWSERFSSNQKMIFYQFIDDGLWVNNTLIVNGTTTLNPQSANWVLYDVTDPYVTQHGRYYVMEDILLRFYQFLKVCGHGRH